MTPRQSIQFSDQQLEPSDARARPGWTTTRLDGLAWLRVTVSTHTDLAIVTLIGELDIAATQSLGRRLGTLVAEGFTRIVIDLADVVFCDAAGLGLLVKTAGRARRRGGWLRLATAGPMIDRIIGITGLRRMLARYGTVEDALADRVAAPSCAAHG